MKIRFIDLFAGLSGIRIGFEQAASKLGIETECILTAEVKPTAIEALQHRYPKEKVDFNIYDVNASMLGDGIDIILGGFPCQPFSAAGNGLGFLDTRGTLFFEIERIINELTQLGKKPKGFILENVEGLLRHGGLVDDNAPYGRTLSTIVKKLNLAGYKTVVKLLDSANYGVPQSRKRVYIVGVDSEFDDVNLDNLPEKKVNFGEVQEHGLPTEKTKFSQLLLSHFPPTKLEGKRIKDKRGGDNNIHSWDIGIKGEVSTEEKLLLDTLLKERRKKKWASIIGIDWMDGMPLTAEQISTFFPCDNITQLLDGLVQKGYLVLEYPKAKVPIEQGDLIAYIRKPDTGKPKGYNIVTGKLSFEFSGFLDPDSPSPTMVAMDMERVGVIDGDGVRHLSITEGLRLFGYKDYDLSYLEGRKGGRAIAFELLGNSVCVPVIELLANRLLLSLKS